MVSFALIPGPLLHRQREFDLTYEESCAPLGTCNAPV